MKIQILSDIHAEFHQDQGRSFLQRLNPSGIDVLVVAGDLAPIRMYSELIPLLVNKYPHVILVSGNHEFYGTSRGSVLYDLAQLGQEYPNLHILEDSHVTIDGQRFIGSTLWFSDDPKARPYWRNLNDFHLIRDFESWVFEVNANSVDFLSKNIKPTDIVVTHHIPTQHGSDRKWWGTPLQPFFVCNMEKTLILQHPKLWIFGHTHDSCDFKFQRKHGTRIICNPFGYAGREENPNYQEKLEIEV